MKPSRFAPGQRGFLQWMQLRQPKLYSMVSKELRGAGLAGLGLSPITATTAPVSSGWAQTLKDLATGLAQAYLTKEQLNAQQKVLDVQLQRAQQGLPPLDIDMAAYGMTPTANVGIAGDTLKWLGIGAAVLAGVYLVPKLVK